MAPASPASALRSMHKAAAIRLRLLSNITLQEAWRRVGEGEITHLKPVCTGWLAPVRIQLPAPRQSIELDRDVLGLSGLTHVIWLEGINDIGAGTATDSIIAGYQNVVGRLHAKGIKVYGATLTSALGISGVDMGDNGPGHDASRMVLNAYIRGSGLYDGVEDFDAVTLDPSTGNMLAEFLPNSTFTQLPWDYLIPTMLGISLWARRSTSSLLCRLIILSELEWQMHGKEFFTS